ncbi:MAG: glycerophosphodiester phosphodiesterase [Chloroflexota bacterium]|nr:glycerophosphodiester phosphodiesterase [Chloroflexota bacterium]
MSAPGSSGAQESAGVSSRPALIAHGGGNGPDPVLEALAASAPFIEVDLWLHRGRLEARHERRVPGPVPLLYEFWYLTPAPRPPYHLEDLLLACEGRASVLLDLKNGLGKLAPVLRQTLAAFGRGVNVVASSQNWPLLREVKVACPQLDLYYSIDTPDQFDLFQSVMLHDPLPAGVSCRHTLLDRRIVRDFHDAGLAVAAWTVDDGDRARDLVRWGVDAITTNRVEEIRAALAESP